MRLLMVRSLLTIALLLAVPACNRKAPEQERTAVREEGSVKGVDRSHKGNAAPTQSFKDAAGKDVTLAAFKGRPLLVNLWASWCAPCVKELPTLDRLARSGQGPQIVAISQDNGPHASVVAFLKTNKVTLLAPYQDAQMSVSGALGAQVLPTSILYDSNGRELWRYVGDLDWTGAEASRLLAEGR